MTSNVEAPAVRLWDVGQQVRRQWLVVVATVAVCIAGAVAFGIMRGTAYTATAAVTVQPITANPFGTPTNQQVNITTERAVILSTEVGARAAQIMKTTTDSRELVARVTVTSPLNSQVMEISAEAGTPDEAAATANAFAKGYLDVRSAAADADADRMIDNIDKQIDELADELPDDADSPKARTIQQQIDSLSDQRTSLTAMAINPGRIITSAAPPVSASSLGLAVYFAGGLAGGLMLGVALALLRDRTDRRVRSGGRLAVILGRPVLDHGPGPVDGELLNRVTTRLGLDHDAPPTTLGVLGTDSQAASAVSSALTDHLRRLGFKARLADSTGTTAPPATELAEAAEADGSDIMLIAASSRDGVARAAMLARRLDKVLVTTRRSTKLADVAALVDEITAAGADIDVIVTSADRIDRAAHRGHDPGV